MNRVEEYYDRHVDREWQRLDRHRTEFAVTIRAIEDSLPPPPADLIDVGSGPGRYSIELAKRGYSLTMVDISSDSLNKANEVAREIGVKFKETIHADALNLGTLNLIEYDAALLMGPLYHLLTFEERYRTVKEILSVLKPLGLVFVSFITRFAPFRQAASDEQEWLPENLEYAYEVLKTGIHNEGTEFPQAYFAHPSEIKPFMESCGFKTLRILGCEGILAGHEEGVNQLQGEQWQAWVEFNYHIAEEPSLLGASDHILYIGQKSR